MGRCRIQNIFDSEGLSRLLKNIHLLLWLKNKKFKGFFLTEEAVML